MKFLTIIRHAKSDWSTEVDDIARPLNERGKNAVVLVGNYLQQQNIKPDLIISSPATRAFETAKAIAELVKYDLKKVKVEPVVHFGASSAIIDMLKELDNQFNDVFLFGHEPILSSLISYFTKTTLEKFPTCSVFRIAFKIDNSSAIKTGNTDFFITPKQLTV